MLFCRGFILQHQKTKFFTFRLAIDKLMQDDFFRSVPDAVHVSNPCHLVCGLERLGHTFLPCYLPGKQFHLFFAGLVVLGQMLIQLAGRQEISI